MSGAPECCALVVEGDPGLREMFELLLEGWTLRFVQDPWAVPDPSPVDADLLVIDEDYAERSDRRIPEWLEALAQRLPTIVLRTPATPSLTNPAILVLPKPFPVSLFLTFAQRVRRTKADAASPPETGP